MGKINWGRVILGGLLAGVVINVVEGISGTIFMEDMLAAMAEHNISMDQSPTVMALYLLIGFAYGIFALWLYAAIRPRYGAGAKTAVYAGLAVWFLGYLMASLSFVLLGIFPTQMFAVSSTIGLVEIVGGTVAGAWLYKEG